MLMLPDGPVEQLQSGTLMRMLIEYQHALALLAYCAAPEAMEMRQTFSHLIRRIEHTLMQRASMDGLESEGMMISRPAAARPVAQYTSPIH